MSKVFEGIKIKLVPMMVGQCGEKLIEAYAKVLTPYFDDENTVFCISSDFCHWGSRFRYTYYDEKDGEIF